MGRGGHARIPPYPPVCENAQQGTGDDAYDPPRSIPQQRRERQMRTLPQLLVHLGTLNVTLRLHGDALSYSSPTNVLQHDTLSDLRRHRDALRALLTTDPPKLHRDAQVVFDERMGVADGLDMSPHHGGPAWLTAIGEALAVKPDPLDDPERASTVAALVASKPKPKHDYRKGWKR